ncbi:MAG: hypothetical protein K6E85_10595 [Lachnospiraceae bacterium]|nr:hypothetical protein [Lachnospiraceae bacterium]
MKRFKIRFIHKALIVLAVFIASLIYFGSGINERFFGNASDTVEMSAATFPTIYIQVGEDSYNRLHGYASNLDMMLMRETITPITSERSFTVFIEENESDVKKLKYEVHNTDGREIESDSFTVLDSEYGPKKVKIDLKETYKSGQEYIVKITLITNQSKRIYYYTRFKMYDNGHISEKLEFVKDFHRILLEGDIVEKEGLKKYLESSRKTDNTSFANVSIKSSFNLVTWGDLSPECIWEELPTFHEFYEGLATIELKSYMKAQTGDGTEYYVVKENFRFQYTEKRVYLYNYDRTMETVYDITNTSLIRDEFKLGISKEDRIRTAASPSQKYMAFVYGRELYTYDIDKNFMTCAFSFKTGNEVQLGDLSRELYDQHDIRLIKVHDNGNVDFLVYGYMNRGEYEGRVGMLLYRYIASGKRIEEQMYIPVNTTFQLLDADFEDFVYLSDKDVLYFSLYDAIYSYDLTTKKLETIAEDVPSDNLVFCEEDAYIAWQDARSDLEAKRIYMIDLIDGSQREIKAPLGENIRLLGRINNNIVYAFAKQTDIALLPDGSRMQPAYRLFIENVQGEILKDYSEAGSYIDSIEFDNNKITLKRLAKKAQDVLAYEAADEDTIMNRYVEAVDPVSITKRVTDKTLTEYYVTVPENVKIESVPGLTKAANSVIDFDTTARLTEPENREGIFYSYCYGEVLNTSLKVSETIKTADVRVGTVINREGRLIWERGIKAARSTITGLTLVKAGDGLDSAQAAMKTLLLNKNIDADTSSWSVEAQSVSDWLQDRMRSVVLDLSGAELDEVLYYVYKSRPVIGFKADGNAVVITAYDAASVTVYEPVKDKTVKYSIREAIAMFEAGGNRFVSYAE